MLLEGRVAFVTGAAGRLGSAIAAELQREGAAVALSDLDPERLEVVRATLPASPPTASLVGDVAAEAEVDRMIAEATDRLGAIDTLVNCAGIFPNAPLLEMSTAEWDRVFAVNLRGVMFLCRALARQWVDGGVGGSIVNVSSGAGRSARAGASHYTSSKAALNMFSQVLAIELGAYGIRVNVVAPGLILDEVLEAPQEDTHPYVRTILQGTPLKRTGTPAEIAAAVAFLASDRSSWTTGAILDVSGGSHAGRPHLPVVREG